MRKWIAFPWQRGFHRNSAAKDAINVEEAGGAGHKKRNVTQLWCVKGKNISSGPQFRHGSPPSFNTSFRFKKKQKKHEVQ